MKKLQLRFKTAEGHKKNFVLSYVKADLDPKIVETAMDKIRDSKIFEKNTVQLYQEVLGASYIDRTETPVFPADSISKQNN
ncbi:DUF2922 domain-containing protein [Companilactobacillus kimchiensis]|uniref:DUF2922 domain-containing protein n=1 Tax=Companilactobacillus kimchiensis TaxID=993692 RepID=A0A0R2LFD4_9LACO|nr:DUF2922 domain-containing protein [Companilactobacillus kimchiensis]KRO00321.1 hypothetical protein IV57_GL001424 [Companilactobacillus kimchiensis]